MPFILQLSSFQHQSSCRNTFHNPTRRQQVQSLRAGLLYSKWDGQHSRGTANEGYNKQVTEKVLYIAWCERIANRSRSVHSEQNSSRHVPERPNQPNGRVGDIVLIDHFKGRVPLSWPFPSFAIFFSPIHRRGRIVSVHCLTGSIMFAHSFFSSFLLRQDCQWRAIFISKASIHPEIRKKQAGRRRGIYPSDFTYWRTASEPGHCAAKHSRDS